MLFVVQEGCLAKKDLTAYFGKSVQYCEVSVGRFADGESRVKIADIPKQHRECVYLFYHLYPDVNNRLAEFLFIVDGLKRKGARYVSAIIPYFCYARQDRVTPNASSLSAKVICDLLGAVGVDEVISLDLHSECIVGFFKGRFANLSTNELFFRHALYSGLKDCVLVAPDVGGKKRCEALLREARAFFGAQAPLMTDWPVAIVDKSRNPDTGHIEAGHILGASVVGKNCIIVDDILASGYTLCKAAQLLKDGGAKSLTAYVTHAVLPLGAIDNIEQSCLDRVYVTDTIAETTSGLAKVAFGCNVDEPQTPSTVDQDKMGSGQGVSSKIAVLSMLGLIKKYLSQ